MSQYKLASVKIIHGSGRLCGAQIANGSSEKLLDTIEDMYAEQADKELKRRRSK